MEEEIWQVFRFLPKRFLWVLSWLRWGQAKLVFTTILPILTLLLANRYAIFFAKFSRVQFTGFGKAQYRFRHQAQIPGKRTSTPAKFPKFWTFYFKEKKLGFIFNRAFLHPRNESRDKRLQCPYLSCSDLSLLPERPSMLPGSFKICRRTFRFSEPSGIFSMPSS